jgi:hypothetical protein
MCVSARLIQTIQVDRHELFIAASLFLKVIQAPTGVHFFWPLLKLILFLNSNLFFYNIGAIFQNAAVLSTLGSSDKRGI